MLLTSQIRQLDDRSAVAQVALARLRFGVAESGRRINQLCLGHTGTIDDKARWIHPQFEQLGNSFQTLVRSTRLNSMCRGGPMLDPFTSVPSHEQHQQMPYVLQSVPSARTLAVQHSLMLLTLMVSCKIPHLCESDDGASGLHCSPLTSICTKLRFGLAPVEFKIMLAAAHCLWPPVCLTHNVWYALTAYAWLHEYGIHACHLFRAIP